MAFKTVRLNCKWSTEEKAQAHLDVLVKSARIIDMGIGCNEILGHHTWFETVDWIDNKMEVEHDNN